MTDPMTREQIEALDGHTPGPWKVCETTIHGKKYGGCWVEGPDVDEGDGRPRGFPIPMTGSGGAMSYTTRLVDRQGHDHNDANARLIAAAPDLRTTCLALMDEVERLTKANANLHKLNREYRLRLNDQFHEANRAALTAPADPQPVDAASWSPARRRLEAIADQMIAGTRDGGLHAGRELKRSLEGVFADDPQPSAWNEAIRAAVEVCRKFSRAPDTTPEEAAAALDCALRIQDLLRPEGGE